GMLSGPVTEGLSEEFAQEAGVYAAKQLSSVRVLAANPGDNEDDDGGPVDGKNIAGGVRLAREHIRNLPRHPDDLGRYLGLDNLPFFLKCFIYEQTLAPDNRESIDWVAVREGGELPEFDSTARVSAYPSAVATYSASSDLCGFGGLKRERVRAVESWRGGPARRDCVFVNQDPALPGFRGLYVARILHFLSVVHDRQQYSCAVITGFTTVGDEPDSLTGMWIVRPDEN
ncbi:hypothetical protein V5O48_019439, partial [Marasmius crinis-equi]